MTKLKQILYIAIVFIILLFAYFFGYKAVIPNHHEQSYIANKTFKSWQPTNESKLSSIIRVSPEFALGFTTSYNTIGRGEQVTAPHNLFKLSSPHTFGFELSRQEEAEFTLKPRSYMQMQILLNVTATDIYINNQRPQSKKTQWSFRDELIVKAGGSKVKGTITVTSGSYDYVGYEGHVVRSVTIPAWSEKSTGYKGYKGQTILLESATGDSSFNLLIYNWNPKTESLEGNPIKIQWYLFWKFIRAGELVMGAMDKPVQINILPLD